MKSMTRYAGVVVGAALLLASELLAQSGPPDNGTKVLVSGDNPAVRKLDKEGGKAISSVSYFNAGWTPVGTGKICFVNVDAPGYEKLHLAIYDNEKVLDYVSNTLMTSLVSTFNTPPYVPLKGKIQETSDGAANRTETCTANGYKIDVIWTGLGEPHWADIKPGGLKSMSFSFIDAKHGEILINGKSAPGTWYHNGGGIGTGAYLTLGETWRK